MQSRGRAIGRRPFLRGGAAALGVGVLPQPFVGDWLRRQPTPDAGEALRFFDSLALMRGRRPGDARPGWVRKWTRPVAVRLVGAVTPPALAGMAEVLDALSAWCGLEYTLALDDAPPGNLLTIDIMDHERLIERYGGPVCMTTTYGRGGALHTGLVEVSERFADCLRHELMHALGFDNHWHGAGVDAAMPSVLAPRDTADRVADFSPWDEVAIRALYDRRLAPGMPRHLALPLASRIVDELLDA
jgi:hypothetical protein